MDLRLRLMYNLRSPTLVKTKEAPTSAKMLVREFSVSGILYLV